MNSEISTKHVETYKKNGSVPINPFRVLVIINTMDAGGAETFIMKVYRTLSKEKVQLDFLINKSEKCFYEDEISKLGGLIYRGVSKSKNPVKSFFGVYRTVKNNKYSAVISIAVHPLASVDLLAAKMGGARMRLVRSTNSSSGGGWLSDFLAKIFRPLVCSIATTCLAPSTEAAVWLFGTKAVNDKQVKLIANGIEVDKFIFDETKRIKKRKELKFEDNLVIGHIGRFNKQKNHMFLLDVFSEVRKKFSKAVLLLIGTGELEDVIKSKAMEMDLMDNIIFTGVRSDIPELLMAMDILVFPSLYEGMPNVVIEAQATSLPCLVSDTITREVAISHLVRFVSLDKPVSFWAECVSSMCGEKVRNSMKSTFENAGYDISSTSDFLTKILLSEVDTTL